jgi:glycosyltransferase involved in cell wall biosynthesis
VQARRLDLHIEETALPTTSPLAALQTPPLARRIGMLGTYPPRLCGLATFAAALEREFVKAARLVTVVAVDDGRAGDVRHTDVRALRNGFPESIRAAARTLSRCDVAIIQHEYGIYGGFDGDEVVDVLRWIEVPTIVVLHTVPLLPTEHQKSVLETICELASAVVVMTAAAGSRLMDGYAVDGAKVTTIPHGAWAPEPARGQDPGAQPAPSHVLTWGLLGPGKGIEHMIAALSMLQDVRPRIRYTVAGVTHPKVMAREGDQYRQTLIRDTWTRGLSPSVRFDDTYRNVAALLRFVASATLIVLAYDSVDQVTSGVLVDAIAAGRPVIATAFPHAVELLSSGAGIVVPHRDPQALADAVRRTLTEPELLHSMTAQAQHIAPTLAWGNVAARYLTLCDEVEQAVLVAGAIG